MSFLFGMLNSAHWVLHHCLKYMLILRRRLMMVLPKVIKGTKMLRSNVRDNGSLLLPTRGKAFPNQKLTNPTYVRNVVATIT